MAHHQEAPGNLPELVRGDDLPIGLNLSWRLQVLIRSGRLRANEQLPGVRDLASGAAVNVNTARSVYRRLEGDGLAVSEQGLGTFVAPFVSVAPALEELAAQVANEALALGIDPRELAKALYAGSPAGDPFSKPIDVSLAATPRTNVEERDARATLRAQIARLEAELAPYPEAREPREATTQATAAAPHVAAIDELEAIRDDLIRRLKQSRQAADKQGERREGAREWREDALADPSAHRWESISNEELGEPGCSRTAVRPRWGPVGALMNWWRVKISSGCP